MYEIEVKVRGDHDPVRERLRERGADRTETVIQVDTYYDHPGRSFVETDEALRIRREESPDEDPVARLAYKGPMIESASKTREEIETPVEEPGALDAILRKLGFEPAPEVHKERERFRLEDYTVTLDAVEGAGTFVEIERTAADNEIDAVRDGARELLCDLGLDPDDHVRTSYLELVLDREGKSHLDSDRGNRNE